jgi:D-serine deaminase-like pyridoxal phosphate-dependent protein
MDLERLNQKVSIKACADQNVLAKTIVAATDTANPEIQIFLSPQLQY